MNSINIFLYCILLNSSAIYSQSACYENLKNEGRKLYALKQYEQAINKYLASLNCDAINQQEIF